MAFYFHLSCAIADCDAAARDISVSDKRRGREEHRVSAQAALTSFVTPPATFCQTLLINPQTFKKNLRVVTRKTCELTWKCRHLSHTMAAFWFTAYTMSLKQDLKIPRSVPI